MPSGRQFIVSTGFIICFLLAFFFFFWVIFGIFRLVGGNLFVKEFMIVVVLRCFILAGLVAYRNGTW